MDFPTTAVGVPGLREEDFNIPFTSLKDAPVKTEGVVLTGEAALIGEPLKSVRMQSSAGRVFCLIPCPINAALWPQSISNPETRNSKQS
jgi:hypothetical protein